ncbi:Lrp/AsnC family transcriptional regulator [Alicyclobacillus curvatus]|nr:Lrp/AsnC family transcriptional regulator [Alicyclobacillus curvatus]
MDQIDARLLALLQENGRITVSDLSKTLNLSRPSVTDRLRRLEEQHIVTGFTANVSPTGVGRDVLVIIEISELKVPCRRFEDYIADDTDILECHRVTGVMSYIMKAAVPSMVGLEALVDRLIIFGRVNTSIVLSSPVKFRPLLPPSVEQSEAT